VSVVPEVFHQLLDVLVEHGVDRDVVGPLVELRLIGKLTINNQIGRLQESGFPGELFDRIAAVAQNPLVAIDIRDRAAAIRSIPV